MLELTSTYLKQPPRSRVTEPDTICWKVYGDDDGVSATVPSVAVTYVSPTWRHDHVNESKCCEQDGRLRPECIVSQYMRSPSFLFGLYMVQSSGFQGQRYVG